jgi:hypothetical protein
MGSSGRTGSPEVIVHLYERVYRVSVWCRSSSLPSVFPAPSSRASGRKFVKSKDLSRGSERSKGCVVGRSGDR